MTDSKCTQPVKNEPRDLEDALVAALDGTCLHEWSLSAAGGLRHIIAERRNGDRFSIAISARRVR